MKDFIKLIALFAILLSLAFVANSVLLTKPALAIIPFGGPGSVIAVCTSPPGFLIAVGPPIPIFLFLVNKPTGHWWAGLAVPGPVPCFPPGSTVPVGFGFIPIPHLSGSGG